MSQEIDGWQVVRRMYMSATAEVFLVRPPKQGSLQVLKRLLPIYAEKAELVELFQREKALGPHLAHPNLPKVLDGADDQGVPYIVSEYVRGCSLARLVETMGGPMRPEIALAMAKDVVSALSHLYSLTNSDGQPLVVAHRDVTPGNVLVSTEGRAVLIDFGLVSGGVSRLDTASNVVKGTWRYASPEQLDGGRVSASFDSYALGCLLYLMVTGRRPFDDRSDPDEILAAKRKGQLSCPEAGKGLDELVRDATAIDPLDRPSMPNGFLKRLKALSPASAEAVSAQTAEYVLKVEREDRIKASSRPTVISAEQRGDDITDPATTADITLVRPQGADGDPMNPTIALAGIVLLLSLIAFALLRGA